MIRLISISPAGAFTVSVDGVEQPVTVPIDNIQFGRNPSGTLDYDVLHVITPTGGSSFPLSAAETSIRAVAVLAFAYYNNLSLADAATLARQKFGNVWVQEVIDDAELFAIVSGVTIPPYTPPVVTPETPPDVLFYRALATMTTGTQIANALRLWLKARGNVPQNEP